MQQQPDKVTALYYRTAQKNMDTLHLDNQMQLLLCYAQKQSLGRFMVYADNGYSGLNPDRPAFSALKADIEARRIKEVVVKDITRLGRNLIDTMRFVDWVNGSGVIIHSLNDDLDIDAGIYDALLADMKGGERR